ncbi:hypothetical protein [Actinosynnema sp. NPDC020468]|uniref:hypothetical protein n=1 Tax=Actinosynnema sp. NPDC020468 TaxID=3154488 RepID=UPI0033EB8F55
MADEQEKLVANALRAQATSSNLTPVEPARVPDEPGMGAGWVLMLAVLLGLAAGTVVAVMTLR